MVNYYRDISKITKNKVMNILDVFHGLENSFVLKRLIPKKSERISFLRRQKIKFDPRSECPNVLNPKHITFPYSSLDENPKETYLDILHELTHCFQREKENINFRKQIKQFRYPDNPKELEAYALGLLQSRKIGMNKKDFEKYIDRDDFICKAERKRLMKNIFKYNLHR